MPPPLVAVVPRKPVTRPPVLSAAARNEWAYEEIAPQEPMDPPRYGDTPARPSRLHIFQSLSMASIRAVQNDSFVMGKKEFAAFASMPRGKSLTWDERVNIVRTDPQAYGSFTVNTPAPTSEGERLEILMRLP